MAVFCAELSLHCSSFGSPQSHSKKKKCAYQQVLVNRCVSQMSSDASATKFVCLCFCFCFALVVCLSVCLLPSEKKTEREREMVAHKFQLT